MAKRLVDGERVIDLKRFILSLIEYLKRRHTSEPVFWN